jgi:hypothetical protein
MIGELSKVFMKFSNNSFNVTDVQLRRVLLDNELEDAVENKLIEL